MSWGAHRLLTGPEQIALYANRAVYLARAARAAEDAGEMRRYQSLVGRVNADLKALYASEAEMGE